jgi:hypothetical protein
MPSRPLHPRRRRAAAACPFRQALNPVNEPVGSECRDAVVSIPRSTYSPCRFVRLALDFETAAGERSAMDREHPRGRTLMVRDGKRDKVKLDEFAAAVETAKALAETKHFQRSRGRLRGRPSIFFGKRVECPCEALE